MEKIHLSTIGFTQTNAESFFGRLLSSSTRILIDVRLHNTSQLAGFAKADDLSFFLKKIGNIEYSHKPILAPTAEMLKKYRKEKGSWEEYEHRFIALMEERKIEHLFEPEHFNQACLLCSEATPHRCHRRLVCEYLNRKWDGKLAVRHL